MRGVTQVEEDYNIENRDWRIEWKRSSQCSGFRPGRGLIPTGSNHETSNWSKTEWDSKRHFLPRHIFH